MKILIFSVIVIISLLQQLASTLSTPRIEDEEHIDNRLKHYIKRFDIVAKSFKTNYLPDLQTLKTKFETSLAKDALKDKLLLLETYSEKLNVDFADYLQMELDKQYINEDILIHRWYIQELLPDLNDHLSAEANKFLDKIKEALKLQDLDEKFNLFTNAADSISDDLWNYLNGDPEPKSVLNAHLKFFQEYLTYLLKEGVDDEFEKDLRSLLKEVEVALTAGDDKGKLRVLDIFDDVSTKFGKFVNEKVIGFEIYKFGE